MVFFTSIIIIVIFYFLEKNGIIFALIIALAGEFINIFLIMFQAKSIKEDLKARQGKEIQDYQSQINNLERTIKDLDTLQKKNTGTINEANARIEDLERTLTQVLPTDKNGANHLFREENKTPLLSAEDRRAKSSSGNYSPLDHLPSGSNRKKPPV